MELSGSRGSFSVLGMGIFFLLPTHLGEAGVLQPPAKVASLTEKRGFKNVNFSSIWLEVG